MRDRIMLSRERKRIKKCRKLEKQQLLSFNQDVEDRKRNKEYLLMKMSKLYPSGDMRKSRNERDAHSSAHVMISLNKPKHRRADMTSHAQGVPKPPLVPSNVELNENSDDEPRVEVIQETGTSTAENEEQGRTSNDARSRTMGSTDDISSKGPEEWIKE